jgi:BlaI family penicillinase repressor
MAASPPTLPEAEQDVLGAIYDLGEATARDVRERLERRRPLAHASVVTLLGRLEEKGLVRRRKADVGKAFVYSATTERTRTFGPMLTRLVRRAFQGNSAALVASLFESRPPDAREIAELDALLEDWRARERKANPK